MNPTKSFGARFCQLHLQQRKADFALTRRESMFDDRGVSALLRLVAVAKRDTGQARRVRLFLLGLYNGPEWPFDLTDLRNLDRDLQQDVLAVLQLDWHGGREVHKYLDEGALLFLRWWEAERPEPDSPA
jgi:hypothetical protein